MTRPVQPFIAPTDRRRLLHLRVSVESVNTLREGDFRSSRNASRTPIKRFQLEGFFLAGLVRSFRGGRTVSVFPPSCVLYILDKL